MLRYSRRTVSAVSWRTPPRDLFRVLNQKPEDRDPYLADDDPMLAAFPYVNGGLFDGDDIEIPPFTDEIMDLLLRKASDDFDWSEISTTIFGGHGIIEYRYDPRTKYQDWVSELTVLCVPTRPRDMFILHTK